MKKAKITKNHITTCIMTLWVRRYGLILVLALLTFACEEPGEIGLELNPENGAFVARYNEIKIPTSIIEYEDILSDNSTRIDIFTQQPTADGRLLTGDYSTQDFGRFQSKAFSSIYLSLSGFNPDDDDFIFDSLVLSIKVDYLYGEQGNFTGNKKILVHELDEEIKIDSVYLTKNSTSYIEEQIGEFNIDISDFDNDTTRVDTVFTTRLSDELGLRLLDKAKTDPLTYDNNIEFRKFFNGIALVSDEGNGVVAGIHAENPSTFMRLYIHNSQDTTSFSFIMQGWDTVGANITRYYNNITLDKSGSPIEGIPDYYTDYQTSNGFSYIQASSGIFTKLNIGSYLNFLDTIDHLVINRAELIIPVENYNDYLEPSGSGALDLYISDIDNKFVEGIDTIRNSITYATIGRILFSKDENENKGQFVGNVTDYIQSLTSGTSSDTLLLVGQTSLWNSVINVNQMVTLKDDIKLNIYYSVLK